MRLIFILLFFLPSIALSQTQTIKVRRPDTTQKMQYRSNQVYLFNSTSIINKKLKSEVRKEFYLPINGHTNYKWSRIYKEKNSAFKYGASKIYPSVDPEIQPAEDSIFKIAENINDNWIYYKDGIDTSAIVKIKIRIDNRGIAQYEYVSRYPHSKTEYYCYTYLSGYKKWKPAQFNGKAEDIEGIITIKFHYE